MHPTDLLRRFEGSQVSLAKLLTLLDSAKSPPVLPFPPGVPLPVAMFHSSKAGGGAICGDVEFWRMHGITDKPWALSYLANGFTMAPLVNNVNCIALVAPQLSVIMWVASVGVVNRWTWDYAKWTLDSGTVYLATSDVLHKWLTAGEYAPRRPLPPYPVVGVLRRVGQAYTIDGPVQVYLYPTSKALYIDFAPWVPASAPEVCRRLSCFPDVSPRVYKSVEEFDQEHSRRGGYEAGPEEAPVEEEGDGGVAEDYAEGEVASEEDVEAGDEEEEAPEE